MPMTIPIIGRFPGDKGNPVHLSEIDNVGYSNRDRRVFNGIYFFQLANSMGTRFICQSNVAYDFQDTNNKDWYKEYYEYLYDPSTDTYNVAASHTNF
jgi:hypothetical protein